MTALLNITDGSTTINLIGTVFRLVEDPRWRPQTPQFKGGGVWQSSPLADGRRLASTNYNNVVDAWTLHVVSASQDDVIYSLQELRRLLNKGVEYWTTDWQDEPVWIEARASCESNVRYAIVKSYQMPEDDDPYQQPFINAHPGATMNDIQLIVEHGIWTDTAPGVGTATEISGLQEWCPVTPLLFDGANDDVNLGSPAVLDDLHDAAFTVEAWVKPDGLGAIGTFASKRRWYFQRTVGGTLRGFIDCAVANGDQITITTVPDDAWVHLAMTWDDAASLRPRIWIDGVEAAYNAGAGTDRNGAIVSDAAENLYIGMILGGVSRWNGHIGWLRISDNIRYAAAFTPPSRCVIPATDANTVWLGIVEGTGATCYDRSGNGNNGAITGATWDADEACCEEYGREATTLDEVYITNHQKKAQLTHVFYYDASVPSYSANLLGAALPFNLLPPGPAINDILYCGVDSTLLDGGPFSSLVFDIGTAGAGYTGQWEYWNGAAWAAFAVVLQDNTNDGGLMTGIAFNTIGDGSVHWPQSIAWASTTVNGVAAWWIRYIITAIPGALTVPTQQNRDIYTVSWPYVDIDEDQLQGDIAALLGFDLVNVSDNVAASSFPFNRCIAGARTLSRGADFGAYINFSDVQPVSGVTLTLFALTAFVNLVDSPTGRIIRYSPLGASAEATRVVLRVSTPLAKNYYGSFHVFLRLATSASTGLTVRTVLTTDTETSYQDSGTISLANGFIGASPPLLVDIGKIEIGKKIDAAEDISFFALNILFSSDGVKTIDLYDVIFIPVDEWSMDASISRRPLAPLGVPAQTPNVDIGGFLRTDSISSPKALSRSLVISRSTGSVEALYELKSNRTPSLQANAAQRLWFALSSISTDDTFGTLNFMNGCTVVFERQQRYLSMRGAR